ncbi:hypothetical protein ACLK1T_17375 [Escherichia coli]
MPGPHCARLQQSPEHHGLHGDGPGDCKTQFSVWLQMSNDIGTNQRINPRCRYAQFAEDFATEILTG